jgi:hypothetical protein
MTKSLRYLQDSFEILVQTSRGKSGHALHRNFLKIPEEAIPEVSGYFTEAWGNRSRIDYGSGMELNFLCWLYVH